MNEQSELFDIVEPNFHWLAGGSAMKASRFESSASDSIAANDKLSSFPMDKVVTVSVSKCMDIPQKGERFSRPRACYPLLSPPVHIFGEPQIISEKSVLLQVTDSKASVKEPDFERQHRRILFDCVDTPPHRRGMPGPNVDFVTGKPIPYYLPYSVHDKTALFESRFESGNLKRASQIGPFEYELLLKPDLNTSGYMNWFYFSISKLTKGTTVRLNIINMYKANSLFNCGMKPLMYSSVNAAMHNIGWVRCGANIKYVETQMSGFEGLYTLSFDFEVQEDDDVLYFAQCFPFTWSYLQNHLSEIMIIHQNERTLRRELLCESLNGNNCDVLFITDFELETSSSTEKDLRPCIFLTARVHPGESNSSWIMKGIIDHLLGDTDVAKALRARFYFVLVPMLNPDGVINGNYRCDLAGFDLNRNWKNPDPAKHRTIFAAKQLMHKIQQNREVLFFCDFHGHSTKHNVFMYGCDRENGPLKFTEMVFPCIMSRIAGEKEQNHQILKHLTFWPSTGVFSFADSSFKMKKEKESTARVVVRRQFNMTHSYTFESSIYGCNFGPHCGQHFSVDVGACGNSFMFCSLTSFSSIIWL